MVYVARLRPLLVHLGTSLLLTSLSACGGQPSSFVTDSKPVAGSSADAQGASPSAAAAPNPGKINPDPGASSRHAGPGEGAGPGTLHEGGTSPGGAGDGRPGSSTPGHGLPNDGSSQPSRGPTHGGPGDSTPGHGGLGGGTPHSPDSPDGPDAGRGGENLPSVPRRSFEIVQNAAGKIDILWVVDNSASMEPEQRNLAINFNKFITQLAGMGHDFHTAITTTDVCQDRMPRALEERMCPVREPEVQNTRHLRGAFVGEWGHTVLTSSDPDLVARFNSYVRQGTDGSSFEHGLTAAHMAIDRSLHGKNEELVRNDAFLSVIVLSDEEDDGIGLGMTDAYLHQNYWLNGLTRYRYTDDDLIAYLRQIKGEGHFSISGIVGTRDGRGKLCSSRVASPQEEGTQYIKAAVKTGGIIRSVCEVDWAESMLKIAQDVAAQAAQVNLPSVPDVPTIEVWVNGAASSNWSYNSGNNAVKFSAGKVPATGSTIKISYTEPQL